jgi:hypothetical protein
LFGVGAFIIGAPAQLGHEPNASASQSGETLAKMAEN